MSLKDLFLKYRLMDNLYLKNFVDNNIVFDKDTKSFYNKLNKHMNKLNKHINNIKTQQYSIYNIIYLNNILNHFL